MPYQPPKHNAHKRKNTQARQVQARQNKRYYPTYHRVWRAHREQQLRKQPLCEQCKVDGKVTAATEVDHINGRADRLCDYTPSNYRSLCKPCHSRKTIRQTMHRGRG